MPIPIESFDTIDDLENYVIPYGTDINPYTANIVFYVKNYSQPNDGGGGFFSYYNDSLETDPFTVNGGTVLQAKVIETEGGEAVNKGKWIRKIDSYINIRFFGVQGSGDPLIDHTDQIQKAIDYAAYNVHRHLKGSTVFFPRGKYRVNGTLYLKDGVSLLGETLEQTEIQATYDKTNDGFLLEMKEGIVRGCNVSNITFYGGIPHYETDFPILPDVRTKGGMYFKALPAGEGKAGGMWNCTFKNILIHGFNGHGLVIEDNETKYMTPNQQIIFENMIIQRQKVNSYCLYIKAQAGQLTFINVGFDGIKYNEDKENDTLEITKGVNVFLEGNKKSIGLQPAVISFINSTFQYSEYGVLMEFCESVTFDTCWFEMLDMAVTARDIDNPELTPSRAINILNSRFANAAGFGSLKVTNQHLDPKGRCITSENSSMNVYNNYVTVSMLAPKKGECYSPFGKAFIMGLGENYGIRTTGNTFRNDELGYSVGIMQYVQIKPDPEFPVPPPDPPECYLNLRDNKIVIVNPGPCDGLDVERIICSVSSGEIISIRAHERAVTFNTRKNIFLSNQSTLTLKNGDIATFIKIDYAGNFGLEEIFQLISVLKSTSPL
ncbi:glycosyl hydrolase family 28-related protein [Flavobacterium sp.]|uniref:glycosyl hydrolase family 28-related protein n=1 Tax=Flavobacterium sp. TaxID=239 RepID=UPI0039E61A18